MALKGQLTGMRGVYLVAAELTKLGFIVSPTSRSAIGADLLVTDQRCKRAFSVQVKTNARTFSFWLIGKHARKTVSRSHIYVLVNIHNSTHADERTEYFVVPSKQAAQLGYHKGNWPNIQRNAVLRYKNGWSTFGQPL